MTAAAAEPRCRHRNKGAESGTKVEESLEQVEEHPLF